MFLALAAIENAVAVNPDLRLELYVHPQTREMICVCCSIYFGGGSSVWHNFRHAGPSWQGFQASQLELGIAWPSSYQGIKRRPKELEPVANLPSLNAETWDGRCSLAKWARGTFDHFRSTQLFAHDQRSILSKMANRTRATVGLIVMTAHRVSLFHVCHGERA